MELGTLSSAWDLALSQTQARTDGLGLWFNSVKEPSPSVTPYSTPSSLLQPGSPVPPLQSVDTSCVPSGAQQVQESGSGVGQETRGHSQVPVLGSRLHSRGQQPEGELESEGFLLFCLMPVLLLRLQEA